MWSFTKQTSVSLSEYYHRSKYHRFKVNEHLSFINNLSSKYIYEYEYNPDIRNSNIRVKYLITFSLNQNLTFHKQFSCSSSAKEIFQFEF